MPVPNLYLVGDSSGIPCVAVDAMARMDGEKKVASCDICDARGGRGKGGQLDLEGGAAKPRETDT